MSRTCFRCGKAIQKRNQRPSHCKREFCNRQCYQATLEAERNMERCATCGKEFHCPSARFSRGNEHVYCSFDCRNKGYAGRQPNGTPVDRFWKRVNKAENGCWEWSGCTSRTGYGELRLSTKKKYLAHRLSYEWFVGPIPADLTIDHLCRNRRCVNPAHLEAVTRAENSRREAVAKRLAAIAEGDRG